MNWPITIAQDKCAMDVMKTFIIDSTVDFDGIDSALTDLEWNVSTTGPWRDIGYTWRWGTAPFDTRLIHTMR